MCMTVFLNVSFGFTSGHSWQDDSFGLHFFKLQNKCFLSQHIIVNEQMQQIAVINSFCNLIFDRGVSHVIGYEKTCQVAK